jgi:ketosteroid isomerase-like protein
MFEPNVELLRPVYERWGQGDMRPNPGVYGPELEWGWSDEFPDIAGVMREPMERSERLLRWLSGWEGWRIEAAEFLSAGERVVVICRYAGRGKESGIEVDQQGAHVWTISDGRASRLEIFSDPARALESAGLKP